MNAKRLRKTRNTIDSLFDKWPSRVDAAAEVGGAVDMIHQWTRRDRIPAEWQFWVVEAARERGFSDVTPEWMLKHHSAFAKRAVDGVAK